MNDERRQMDNVSITPHELDTFCLVIYTTPSDLVDYSRRLRLVSIEGERLRFCPTDRDRGLDRGLEEYRRRAAERDIDLERDIEREREREAPESLDRDLLRPCFAPLERERLRP